MGVDAKKKREWGRGRRRRPGYDVRLRLHESEVYEKGALHARADFSGGGGGGVGGGGGPQVLKVASEKRRNGQLFECKPDASKPSP